MITHNLADALQARFGGKRQLVVDFTEAYQDVSVEGAEVVDYGGSRATYAFEIIASELISRLSRRYSIRDLAVHEPDIEATIRNIYEGRLLETAHDDLKFG